MRRRIAEAFISDYSIVTAGQVPTIQSSSPALQDVIDNFHLRYFLNLPPDANVVSYRCWQDYRRSGIVVEDLIYETESPNAPGESVPTKAV